MIRPRRLWIASGLALISVSATGWLLEPPARADTVPGSGLGSYELAASAAGLQSTYSSAGSSSPTAEGEVPDAQAQLQSGPFGEGLSSLAWPGPIAANAGTTAVVLNAPVPPQYADDLNDPVRAQAETGRGPSSVTNTAYPGTTMSAQATDRDVAAEADVGSSISPAGGFSTGPVKAASEVSLTGSSLVRVSATSEVQNITLAGGLITIKAVSSTAQATTDGVSPQASGTTVVAGLSVDGVAATVDQDGVHLASASSPAGPAAVVAAAAALSQAGLVFYAGRPLTTRSGGAISYTSASLMALWTPSSSSGTFSVTFGGLTVSADATPGTGSTFTTGAGAFPLAGASSGRASVPIPATGAGTATTPSVAAAPSIPAGGTAPPATSSPAAAPRLGGPPAAASNPPVDLPAQSLGAVSRPLSAGWLVLALIGALAIGIGSTALPDRMLGDTRSRCKLEDPP
jgi:hypothetical protein